LAEEALRQSEERFRAAFGSAALGMALASPEGRWLQVNPSMCEITGYTEEELLATDFQSITHPDDLRKGLDGIARLVSGEIQYFYLEKRYLHKSGQIVWARVSMSLVRDAWGEPLYFVAQVQDITEARADKENLERMIRQNRSILASAGEGIYGLDLDERTSFVNPAAERMLGYGPGELAGRHQHDIVSHLNAEGVPYPEDECPVYAALRDGDVHSSSDEVFRRKDGSTFPVEYVSTPIREGGEVVGAVVTFRDITRRKRAEEELRKSEARFRLLAEKMSDLVCLHEPDGRYVYISPSCRRLLGYEPEELLGTDPYDLFHPDDLERIRTEAHDKALEGQEAISITYRIRKKSGEYTWFETLTEPILDEGGEVVRLQTSSRDVSERKRVERVLAEAARAKAAFLAEVSH
jgi:PAS domain S-box-containing protein